MVSEGNVQPQGDKFVRLALMAAEPVTYLFKVKMKDESAKLRKLLERAFEDAAAAIAGASSAAKNEVISGDDAV
jgi:hypothetical protein